MNKQDNGHRINVLFNDGSWIEFRAFDSYDSAMDGRMCIWQDVILDGKFYDFYSIPINQIKSIREIDLNRE